MGRLGNFLLTIRGDNETYLGTLTLTDDSLASAPGETGSDIDISLPGNGSAKGVWVLANPDIDVNNATERDPVGASTYVIAVVMIYGVSIVFLIASHVFIKKRETYKDSERQTNKYLEQAPVLREQSCRDSYRKLKLSIIPMIAQSPTGREMISRRPKYFPYLIQYRIDDRVEARPPPRPPSGRSGRDRSRRSRGSSPFDPGRLPHHGILKKTPPPGSLEQPEDPGAHGYQLLVPGPDTPATDRRDGATLLPDDPRDSPWSLRQDPSLPGQPYRLVSQSRPLSPSPQQYPEGLRYAVPGSVTSPLTSQDGGEDDDPDMDLGHDNEGGIVSLSESCLSLSSLSVSSSLTSDDYVFSEDSEDDDGYGLHYG